MKIVKYNRGNTGYTIGSAASKAANSSSSSSSSTTSSYVDNYLWGNHNDGTLDIEDTIFVNGSVYAMPSKFEGSDEDEDDERKEGDIEDYEQLEFEPFEDDNGGNVYAENLVKSFGDIKADKAIEGDSTYGKTVYLDYPERKADNSNKTDLLTILKDHEGDISTNETNIKKLQDAKVWGQGIKANNYNVTGNMKDVGDINFSGDSRLIGSMSDSSKRPETIYANGSLIMSNYNGSPWGVADNIKNIKAMTYVQPTHIAMNSVTDSNKNGHYFNNPRVLWYVYNPTTLKREGHWWLGPTWTNDYDEGKEGDHLSLSLHPAFNTDGYVLEDGKSIKREYFEQFTFSVASNLKAYNFIRVGGKDTEFLMADGSVKELDLSGFVSGGDLSDYAKKSDIPSVPTKVSQLENDAKYITKDDIPTIPTKVSELQNDVPYAEYDKNAPVILFSGSIHSNNGDTSSTNYQPWAVRPNLYSLHTGVEKLELSYLEVNGEKKPSLVVKVVAKDGWTVKATSVNSSVTLNTHWNPTADFGGNRRSQGFWTTGGVYVDGKIYLNVWRTHDDNNDSTTNDCIAWSVKEMNLTIFGTAYKNS